MKRKWVNLNSMKKSNESVNLVDLHDTMHSFISNLEVELGYEITVTSGYRSKDHPIESAKSRPGEHTTGLAIDVASVGGTNTYDLVSAAIKLGCKRIGINRNNNFVHLGLDSNRVTSIWHY